MLILLYKPFYVCIFFFFGNDFLPSYIYIYIWDCQKWELHLVVWFSQFKGILKHMHIFLGGYLHSLIRFFPMLITLYSQKINHLNVQKYFFLNPSFLIIWYIHDISLRKLIQKRFFFFFELNWTMCRNCFGMLVTWNVIQSIMTGVD